MLYVILCCGCDHTGWNSDEIIFEETCWVSNALWRYWRDSKLQTPIWNSTHTLPALMTLVVMLPHISQSFDSHMRSMVGFCHTHRARQVTNRWEQSRREENNYHGRHVQISISNLLFVIKPLCCSVKRWFISALWETKGSSLRVDSFGTRVYVFHKYLPTSLRSSSSLQFHEGPPFWGNRPIKLDTKPQGDCARVPAFQEFVLLPGWVMQQWDIKFW